MRTRSERVETLNRLFDAIHQDRSADDIYGEFAREQQKKEAERKASYDGLQSPAGIEYDKTQLYVAEVIETKGRRIPPDFIIDLTASAKKKAHVYKAFRNSGVPELIAECPRR